MGISSSSLGHPLLQVEPAQPGQLQVQYQTTWRLSPRAGQEFLRGGEGLDPPPGRPDQSSRDLPEPRGRRPQSR